MSSRAMKWKVQRSLLRGLKGLSQGVATGYRHGFDSGEMLDYVYEDRARGRFLIGKVADRVYLNAVGWRGVRARKELLKSILIDLIEDRSRSGLTTTVLDVASGPGRYLQETCLHLKQSGRLDGVSIICRDLDKVGLEQGRRRASELGLTSIRYETGDACDPASLLSVTPRPEIVVASGIYELLDERLIRRSMSGIHQLLAEGGHFVFTTQVDHPQLEMIANVLVNRHGQPWVMDCRSVEEVEGWAREAGFTVVESRMEDVGISSITTCTRLPDPAG